MSEKNINAKCELIGGKDERMMFIVAIYGSEGKMIDIYLKDFAAKKNEKTAAGIFNITLTGTCASVCGMVWSKSDLRPAIKLNKK
mgnify:CR=1 FL=1